VHIKSCDLQPEDGDTKSQDKNNNNKNEKKNEKEQAYFL
jgi:hypothetical protein